MIFAEVIRRFEELPISTQILLELFSEYRRPYDKIDELRKQGYLVQLRRGLYVTSDLLSVRKPEPFLIANHLYGPSYISLESALSFWGLIPERVVEITSVTTRLSKRINTACGNFEFVHVPLPYYSFGLSTISFTKKQSVMMATPEKALCDKIVLTSGLQLRSRQQALDYLCEDLRIDYEQLHKLEVPKIESWIPDSPKKQSMKKVLDALRGL